MASQQLKPRVLLTALTICLVFVVVNGRVLYQVSDSPGNSGDAPGQTGNFTNNGNNGNGNFTDSPGNSGNAPGQTGNFTNNSNGNGNNGKGSGNGKGPGGVNSRCPDACQPHACLMSASGGYLCTQCQGNLIVNTTDGTCSCPVGKYNGNGYSCLDCDKGAFCPGGPYGAADKVTCGGNMTTMGKRALNKWSCVNTPGSYYTVDANGTAVAVTCPPNTYSPGLKKQRACVPCPPGTTTAGKSGKSSSNACGIPPGYYLKGPGSVAPCPQGEYKEGNGPAALCTKCPAGVTTTSEASPSITACKVLLPGYSPLVMVQGYVATSQLCPQKYVCLGGIPTSPFDPLVPDVMNGTTITKCPNGSWTEQLGASSVFQCMTPPGFQTVNGSTTECPQGSYRAEWAPVTASAACTFCGEGFFAEPTAEVTVYAITPDANVTKVDVRTTSMACYAQGGQGIYYSLTTNTYKAVDCGEGQYGMVSRTNGLVAFPCRSCGEGFTTSKYLPESAKYYVDYGNGRGGFASNKACVSLPGWGLGGRGAMRCKPGTWNAPGSTGSCQSCPLGLTTLDNPLAQQSADNCTVAPGFGFHEGMIMACPTGTYNGDLRGNATAPCTSCPTGLTTTQPGGLTSADCNMCAPGYGGASCATQCGGGAASFGGAGRPRGTDCTSCPSQGTGFSYDYLGSNQPFQPDAVARAGADSPGDCLNEFSQIMDSSWFMGGAAALVNVTSVANVTTFEACAADCKADATCQYITFDYDARICWKKTAGVSAPGHDLIAFKATAAGDVSASGVRAKALAAGSYTFWRDNSTGIGADVSAMGAVANVQACLDLCDTDVGCAAVIMSNVTSPSAAPAACNLVRGDTTPGVFKRSLTKTVVTRLTVASALAV